MKLCLFLTKDLSLRWWEDAGILSREMALYLWLARRGVPVCLVSYGDESERDYEARLPGIRVVCNEARLAAEAYIRSLPARLAELGSDDAVLKSNQVLGADVAMATARALGRPFVARLGYLFSFAEEQKHGEGSPAAAEAMDLEARVFGGADRIVVTTEAIRKMVCERHGIAPDRVTVIPNYVDTDAFSPGTTVPVPNRLVTVGRLAPEKNLATLLDAIEGLGLELVVVGGGPLERTLRAQAAAAGTSVLFLGTMPHARIPEILRTAALYVQPSIFEGHPKTILEAMACGLPVVAGNVPGVREWLAHRRTGFLCELGAEAIRAAILEVLGDADLRREMGRNARRFAVENFSLPRVVEQELAVLRTVAGESGSDG